jgi:hypothetical protein
MTMTFTVGVTAIGVPLQLYTFEYNNDLKVVVHCGTFLDSICGAPGFLQKLGFANEAAAHGIIFYKPKANLVTEYEICTVEEVEAGGMYGLYVDQVGAVIIFERLHGYMRQLQGLAIDESPLSSLDIIRRQEWEIHLRCCVITGCPIANKFTDLDHLLPEFGALIEARKHVTLHRNYIPVSVLLYQTLFMHSHHAKELSARESANQVAASAEEEEEVPAAATKKCKSRNSRRLASRRKLQKRAKMTKDQIGHVSENDVPLVRTCCRFGRRKVDSNYWSDDDTETFRGCYFAEV